jgi:hypothetical protein
MQLCWCAKVIKVAVINTGDQCEKGREIRHVSSQTPQAIAWNGEDRENLDDAEI